jgi:hypothetical protein
MRALLGCLSVMMLSFGVMASPALASDNTYLATVASAVESASQIEAWRLSCLDTLSPGVIFTSAKRVVGRAADLDSVSRAQLGAILQAASRDTADCVDSRCGYCPGYRLVINDREPPIEVIVTEGCTSWRFTRAGKVLSNPGGGCGYLPEGILEPMKALLRQIYGAQY